MSEALRKSMYFEFLRLYDHFLSTTDKTKRAQETGAFLNNSIAAHKASLMSY